MIGTSTRVYVDFEQHEPRVNVNGNNTSSIHLYLAQSDDAQVVIFGDASKVRDLLDRAIQAVDDHLLANEPAVTG